MEENHLLPARFFVKAECQDDLSSRLESSGDEVLDSRSKPQSKMMVDVCWGKTNSSPMSEPLSSELPRPQIIFPRVGRQDRASTLEK